MAKTEQEKAADARREELRKANEEAEKRMAESVPTPSQEENDKAKLGVLEIDKKADAKVDEKPEEKTSREAKPAATSGSYQTRSGN